MPALRELQADVMQALLSGSDAAAERHVRPGPIAAARRLEIYHHNLHESLTQALTAVYPTVAELVGPEFFRHAARRYIASHPSRSGNLHDFGSEMPRFLERFEAVAALPYLPDVARLEWAWHTVFHIEAIAPIDAGEAFARIAAVPPERQGRIAFRWQPAAVLLSSSHPVVRIWEWHQQAAHDERDVIDLDAGPQAALVQQNGGEVWVHPLALAEHALLAKLHRGAPLDEAAGAALELDAGFDDLAQVLARHIARGVLLDPVMPG